MHDTDDDQIQGRLFDPHLTGRLLGYIRPYLWPMVAGLVMLVLLSLSTPRPSPPSSRAWPRS